MKRVALLASFMIAIVACILTYYALAQSGFITRSVGTPSCQAFSDAQGNRCYRLKCNPSPDAYTNYETCDGQPISTALDSTQLCERPNVTINNPINCNAAERPPRISYSWTSADGTPRSETLTMNCPHSCQRCGIYPNAYGSCPTGYRRNSTTGCCVETSIAQNCTTAGWNGDCPPGTTPDGYGWCCAPEGCPVAVTRESSGKNPAPTLSDCCDDLEEYSCITGGGEWNNFTCTCLSPIVVDVAGNGFNLTTAAGGVFFDIAGTGAPEQISWTAANSDDAWLALDRNGNGVVDNGKELFGSSTAQPVARGEWKHGFRALAMFDTAAYGGNGDGLIDNRDGVFSSLKLWQDRNHNGFSEVNELQTLSASVISVIYLKYKESRHKDENGNWFRYRARVTDASGAQAGRWAWDVFVQKPR